MGREERKLKKLMVDHERAKARHFAKQTGEKFSYGNINETHGTAIITSVNKNNLNLLADNDQLTAILSPGLYGLPLAVGDKVQFSRVLDRCIVESILPRKSFISRMRGDATRDSGLHHVQHVLAANVDVAVVVAAAAEPAFHPRFIDRYLIACQNGNVSPLICLNKCDLTTDRDPALEQYQQLSIPVLETSTVSKDGIEALKNALSGKVAVFMGQSGVGKSSLVNILLPDLQLRTKTIGTKTERGRHTTTGSSMYEWEPGSFIIDTPGIRSLDLSDIPREEIKFYFPEFDTYNGLCKFSNCSHDHEPGCAIKEAVDNGKINEARYDSYLRIVQE